MLNGWLSKPRPGAGFLKDRKKKQGLKTAICEPCAENNVKPKKVLTLRLRALPYLIICKRLDGQWHILRERGDNGLFTSPGPKVL